MEFKTFFFSLTSDDQDALATKAGTSPQMLAQIARGHKHIELGFADVIVALCGGSIALGDLPLTDRALAQDAIRSTPLQESPDAEVV